MARPALELADISRQHGPAYRRRHRLSRHQLRLMRTIEICRTATLGGHVEECDHCHRVRISYNSCRNRHCPKCGSLARARWLHQRQAELLPAEYFHVVFTLPAEIAELALRNQKILYDLLFRVGAETLLTIARDRRLFRQGKLQFPGQLYPLQHPTAFDRYLQPLEKSDWVVYAKPPFGGPQQVLEYLGRYTHRVAISNQRLLSLQGGRVTFRWKDYRHRRAKRQLIAQLLAQPATELLPLPRDCAALLALLTGRPPNQCPDCLMGSLYRIEWLPPIRYVAALDSS